jgi:hypothetical protein
MTHPTIRNTCFACALLLSILPTTTSAHPIQDADAAPHMDMAAMMEAMRLAQPGPEHAELAALAGDWVTKVSVLMAPGTPPMEQETTATAKMILSGRFLEHTSAGDFMGTPFESQSYLGFDRRREEYTLMGMDTLGTYWVTGAGVREEDGVIRMHGVDDDPAGKQVFTFEYEIFGPNEYEHRILFTQIGGQHFDPPFQMVTIRNKRKLVGTRFDKVDHHAPSVLDAGRVARGEELAAAIVETACGECQFDLPGESCDLAVRVGDVAWFVSGTSIDDHGDAHASDGFCNAVRHARVSGHVENDRFVVTDFELVHEDHHDDEG